MVRRINDCVSILECHLRENGLNYSLLKFDCIIHQEALCAKLVTLNNVIKVIVSMVNLILYRGLNHKQFRKLLDETDLLYFCDVRWSSCVALLERAFGFRKEISEFHDQKNLSFPELHDRQWISKMAFLTDITSHLNDLNKKLQCPKQLVNDLYQHVQSFEKKL